MLTIEKPRNTRRPSTSGFAMSEWNGRQEEMMEMVAKLNGVMGTTEFRDRDIDPVTAGCCSCASGQSAVMNFCKHER